MRYRLAVEDMEPQHWIAWMLDLPACFSSARTEEQALKHAPGQIAKHHSWLSDHDPSTPIPSGSFDIELVETFHSFPSPQDPEYLVNAFFEDDRRPLNQQDVDMALRLFEWTRQDLMDVLQSVKSDQLKEPLPGEVHGSILGILAHIAGAENWYLGQLELGLKSSELPEDVLERLEAVRTNTRSQLVKLVDLDTITESYGEKWSPRKILRRALWHERDHTQHIAKLLSTLPK